LLIFHAIFFDIAMRDVSRRFAFDADAISRSDVPAA